MSHGLFLDPVGSLVSTLLVGCWLVGCHTFSKFVYFKCCSVVMMVLAALMTELMTERMKLR